MAQSARCVNQPAHEGIEMDLATIALIAAIAGFIADATSTAYAMRRGLVEVGRLSRRLLGSNASDRELLVWHSIKIAGAVAIWHFVPADLSPWILFGLAAPTLFIAGRNVVRARKA
jgi:hypothetical protein